MRVARWSVGRLMLCAAIAVAGAGASAFANTGVYDNSGRSLQQRVLLLVNRARAAPRRCGREQFAATRPLRPVAELDWAAGLHATDMARGDYFEHTGRDGSQPRDRLREAGYDPQLTGENLAFGPDSAEEVVAGWLASPGHCANIMDPRFRDMGLAIAFGRRRGAVYWVQTLGWSRR
jgi:uncharacterized protein YkwD